VIEAHEHKLDVLIDHKNGLMQNLFPKEGKTVPKHRFPEFRKDGNWVKKKIIETADKKIKWSFTGGPFGSNLKASDYTLTGIRIIQLQNIGEGEFKNEYKIYTSTEKADELLSCNIYSGDIILSKMGDPVGRACIIPFELNRCVMASDGIRLAIDEEKYSKYFIYSLINSKGIREAIEKKATGSTRKRIGLDELKNIDLIIPKSLKEQEKIASCIFAIDELITAQKEKIDQLKLHKKGLMQGLFPKVID
jgi:type I restriction enzyme S subunit